MIKSHSEEGYYLLSRIIQNINQISWKFVANSIKLESICESYKN